MILYFEHPMEVQGTSNLVPSFLGSQIVRPLVATLDLQVCTLLSILFSSLHCTLLYYNTLCPTLLYSALLWCARLYSTTLYYTVLYYTLFYSTPLFSILLCSTLLYSTLPYLASSTILYSFPHYFTLPCPTLLQSTLLFYDVRYLNLSHPIRCHNLIPSWHSAFKVPPAKCPSECSAFQLSDRGRSTAIAAPMLDHTFNEQSHRCCTIE